MSFTLLDWSAIVGYLAITLILGLWFRGRSGKSVDDYFVSGRNVNWWLAGTSMVATTFAADTPLVVTGLVYSQGISGNWLWWGFLFSGMMTVFLFARLWRRSGLLTDVQFAEIRYSGKPAAFLRGFRAIYLGLLMNCVILGWVTKAMTSIVSTTLANTPMLNNISAFMSRFGSVWSGNDGAALAICVLFLIPFTGLYVALGGLWGVLWTDLFQFVLKMSIVIAVAYYAIAACGGMSAVIASLQQMQAHAGGNAESPLNFLPNFSRGVTSEPMWMVPLANFFVFIGLQWWAFWYPGRRARRRRLHRPAHLQRPRREAGPALGALVQHRPLRHPPVAVDPHRRRGHRALPRPRASRNRLHDGAQQLPAAPVSRHRHRRIPRRLHVHHRHAVELGRVVPGVGLLPPLRQQERIGKSLRAGLAAVHRAAGHRGGVHFGAARLHRLGLGNRAASRRGHRRGLHPALVLVAHQCLERNFGHGVLAG